MVTQTCVKVNARMRIIEIFLCTILLKIFQGAFKNCVALFHKQPLQNFVGYLNKIIPDTKAGM